MFFLLKYVPTALSVINTLRKIIDSANKKHDLLKNKTITKSDQDAIDAQSKAITSGSYALFDIAVSFLPEDMSSLIDESEARELIEELQNICFSVVSFLEKLTKAIKQ